MDLALDKLQRLICYKTQQTKPSQSKFIETDTVFNKTEINNERNDDFL